MDILIAPDILHTSETAFRTHAAPDWLRVSWALNVPLTSITMPSGNDYSYYAVRDDERIEKPTLAKLAEVTKIPRDTLKNAFLRMNFTK